VNEWRLFIDSSKRSLKAVLLHNGNHYASLPISHSVYLTESYENIELVLTKIGYTAHDWMICGDMKLLCMLLGQQAGYTKYHVSYVNGTVEQESNTGSKTIGNHGHLLKLGARIFCVKGLSIQRKYCCHHFMLN
jgi:hypothetical protein